jgi:hypothetical protein
MKTFLFSTLLLFAEFLSAQSKGFEFLSSSKSSLESIIKVYASAIPDSSRTYKKYYLPLANTYNKAKSSYNGYRGSMKDCILNYNTKTKIQHCLQSNSVSIKDQLDSLNSILTRAYFEAYSQNLTKSPDPTYSGKNTGLITGDVIKSILDTLLNGALKLSDQIQKYRKDYKDGYLNAITSKEYDLADFDDLLIKKISTSPK